MSLFCCGGTCDRSASPEGETVEGRGAVPLPGRYILGPDAVKLDYIGSIVEIRWAVMKLSVWVVSLLFVVPWWAEQKAEREWKEWRN